MLDIDWKKYPFNTGIIEFPKDEGSHLTLMEWWYGNFHLKTKSGRLYTFMIAYFKTGLRMVSLCDLKNKDYTSHTDQGFIISHKNKKNITHYRLDGKDEWYQKKGLPFEYQLKCTAPECELDIEIVALKPPLPVGGKGYVELGTSGSSYYYSLTRLQVKGRLKIGKISYPVTGLGWIDHQYGHFHPTFHSRGYEWFSIQLDNCHEIICYHLYEKNKPTVKLLNIYDEKGKLHNIQNFSLKPLDYWTSPQDRNFARKWQLTVKDKMYPLDLNLETVIDNQLINFLLYEGRININGYYGKHKVTGLGFAELSFSHGFRLQAPSGTVGIY